MARGTEIGIERLVLVAQLAREPCAVAWSAREVADFARWLLRSQASLIKIRDRIWAGAITDTDRARLARIHAALDKMRERTGIRPMVNATTYQIRLVLPSGESNCADNGVWEVR